MKILLLSTGGHIGGEETFTRNLAKALIDRGHYVIAVAGGPVQKQDLEKGGIPLAEIDITRRSIFGILQGVVRLKRYIDEIKPDVVHCQSAGPAIMGGIIKIFRCSNGEKWIYHDHGINRTTYKWLPFFLNSLDLTITNSDFELVRLKANGVKDERIVRIHNGIEPGDFSFPEETRNELRRKYRNDFGITGDEFVLGYIGRLSPEKGCDLLIPAIKLVSDNNPETKLIIVGDGILRDKLQEDVRSFNLEQKIIFTGFRSDIPGILTCIDALVLPSYIETFSLTTLQAMGSGIPVIASDTGGNPEQIVNNFNGYLFDTGRYDSLTERIIQLINNRDRAGMGHNGNMLVKKYLNATRMVDEIEYQYKRRK
jgi:glycosyltransferase involved in cell wall biosynthesis